MATTLDVGIDLGTCNMVAGTRKKGILVREPAVVAINTKTKKVIGVGSSVYEMIGREHGLIEVIHPLENGVISNYSLTHTLVDHVFTEAGKSFVVKPKVIACVPCNITIIEAQSLIETFRNVGAREVFLIKEPVAAALGIGLEITKPFGNLVVDIGGGTTDVAVISLGGVVSCESCLAAGNAFDKAIKKYVKDSHGIILGDQTTTRLKEEIASLNKSENLTTEIKGHSYVTSLPERVSVSSKQLYPHVRRIAEEIIICIKIALEDVSPELMGDIKDSGIHLTGGTALLKGLDSFISSEIGIPVTVPPEPIDAAIKGVLEAFSFVGKTFYGFYDPFVPDFESFAEKEYK